MYDTWQAAWEKISKAVLSGDIVTICSGFQRPSEIQTLLSSLHIFSKCGAYSQLLLKNHFCVRSTTPTTVVQQQQQHLHIVKVFSRTFSVFKMGNMAASGPVVPFCPLLV